MQRTLSRIGLSLALVFALAFAAVGQSAGPSEVTRWSVAADAAEQALDSENSTDNRLEALRAEMVAFRTGFREATGQNSSRIATLREQLAALGPEPEGEGATPEAPDVAAAREELKAQLQELLVPVQRAEAEFVRADAIISQIDQALRDRQAEQLLETTPSPLYPIYWQPALLDMKNALAGLWNEAPETGGPSGDLRQTLPVTLSLTALGLVLIFRGRNWSQMIVRRLHNLGGRGFGIWRFLVSLLRIFLPFAGLNLLALAAISTGFFGPRLDEMFMLFAFLGGMMLGVRWVSERVFARDDDEALIPLSEQDRRIGRFHVSIITALIVVAALVAEILDAGDPSPASKSVLLFPITVLAAVSLYFIGKLLGKVSDPEQDDTVAAELRASTMARVMRFLGKGAILVAIVTPVLAAIGYLRAADALLPPYFMTLTLLGLVMALQRFAADVYGAVTGQGIQARDTLLPVLFGFILLVLVMPLLALVWGVRVTDLTELWAVFLRGFAVGDSQISPTDFIAFAAIFAVGYVLTRLVQSALKSNVLPKTRIDAGGQNAIVSGLGYVGIFLATLAAITGAGIDLSSLAIVAGALSVGIGFGLQNIVSNFVSGIILLIERPISEGDWIEVGDQMGYVRGISVRSTRIETFDKTDVIVPNADLISGTVTNYTRGNTVGRVIIPVGVAYGSDTRQVETILREIAEAHPMVLLTPPPSIFLLNFGADALEFEVRCVLRDVNFMMNVKNDINHEIVAKFAQAGIEIPFAQRDVWLRNPESLRSHVAAPSAGAPHSGTTEEPETSEATDPEPAPPDADAPEGEQT
ncbi:DUF3772 domain-containing protein [Sulfitobacter geojensis]|uniref:DUF3772 domain-containing protein n=1 Tax=Sulfitobacter geojensis TaxID=1342299 RepID=UPI00046AFCC6|nr:DUF3772 domain-containing protein [Sulfitobacter geojensis]KHA52496.1 Mechanosensitive ion channel family protein [Sulfitobacter geojensis]NYI28826.1 small-conductance mechanosensitive channel [Sulfitobacter geojensis]